MIDSWTGKGNKVLIAVALWAVLVLYMGFIFYMSSEDSSKSHKLSISIVQSVKEYADIGSVNEKNEFVRRINFDNVVRKLAHFIEYFILAVIMFFTLHFSNIGGKYRLLIIFTACLLYSISDEVHQIFVAGRTPGIFDVLIDTLGSLSGIYLFHRCTRGVANNSGKTPV